MQIIQDFLFELTSIFLEMSPYLLFGFLVAGILHVYFPQKKIEKYLGRNNFFSVINAAILGVPLPLCSCGVIPTGISFYRNGASKGSTVSFLISTPQTGIDSILITYSLLGFPFAIIRAIVALITGIIGGLISNFTYKKEVIKNKQIEIKNQKKDTGNPIKRIFNYAFIDFLQDLAKWLSIGVLIAAFISVLIPDDFFSSYIGNTYIEMLLVLIASIPLYVCATSSVPIAAVLIMKGISPGAALIFLMAGPATNAATMTVIAKTLGKKTFFVYLFTIIGGAFVSGILINTFLPKEWFQIVSINSQHIHQHFNNFSILHIISGIVLFLLIINAFRLRYFSKKAEHLQQNNNNFNMKIITISVKGMDCNHCKRNVENNLSTMQGVKNVEADLNKEEVRIEGEEINQNLIEQKIIDLGYKVTKEKE